MRKANICPRCGSAMDKEGQTYFCPICQDFVDNILNEIEMENEMNEPEIDDTVHCCPNCEQPNQFGELCIPCQRNIERERAYA